MLAWRFVLIALLAAALTGCDLPWARTAPEPPTSAPIASPPTATAPQPTERTPIDATPTADPTAPTEPSAPTPADSAPAEPSPVTAPAEVEPAPVNDAPAASAPVAEAPAEPAPAPLEGAAPEPAASQPVPPAAKGLLLSPAEGVTLIQPDGWTRLDGNPAGSLLRLRRNEGVAGWQPTFTLSRLARPEVSPTTDATTLAASYAAALANRLDAPTAKVLGAEVTSVAGRPAGLVRVDFESSEQPMRALQWLVPTAGGVYLLSGVGGREGFAPEIEAELGSIVRSLTLPSG